MGLLNDTDIGDEDEGVRKAKQFLRTRRTRRRLINTGNQVETAKDEIRNKQQDLLASLHAVASCFKGDKISNMGLKLSEAKPSAEKIGTITKSDPIASMFSLNTKDAPRNPKVDSNILEVDDVLSNELGSITNAFKTKGKSSLKL